MQTTEALLLPVWFHCTINFVLHPGGGACNYLNYAVKQIAQLRETGLCKAINYRYVQGLKKRLENAFQKANAFCEKEALRSKQRFDKIAKSSKLSLGDFVLEKRVYFKT